LKFFWSLGVTLCHFIFLFILGFIAHIKITVNLRIFFFLNKIELFWSLGVTSCHFFFLYILGIIAHIKITVNLRIFLNSLFWVLFQHTKYILRQSFPLNMLIIMLACTARGFA
jgi:hypothetical protein